MKGSGKWIEHAKSLLILLLTLSAVFLAWKTGLFQRMLPQRGSAYQEEPASHTSTYTAAAKPVNAAVTSAVGMIHGVSCNDEKMEGLLQSFRPVLGETLGSAGVPFQVDEEEWQRALEEPGLFLDYGNPVSLNVLARWFGTASAFDPEKRASRVLLSLTEEEEVKLYFLDEQGTAFCSDTLALGSALFTEISAYLPNGADFAMEIKSLSSCDPYTVILRELPRLYAVYAEDADRDAVLHKAAELCRVSLSTNSSFQEQDGMVYLGDTGRLRLEADGSLRYIASQRAEWGETPEEADQIELSRMIFAQLNTACGGIGELAYTGTEQGAETTEYRFVYRVLGINVRLSSGAAGWTVFRNGRLEEFGFRPRTYLPSGSVERIPPLQAAAAAGNLQPGSTPELVLSDPGSQVTIEPVWSLRERRA